MENDWQPERNHGEKPISTHHREDRVWSMSLPGQRGLVNSSDFPYIHPSKSMCDSQSRKKSIGRESEMTHDKIGRKRNFKTLKQPCAQRLKGKKEWS